MIPQDLLVPGVSLSKSLTVIYSIESHIIHSKNLLFDFNLICFVLFLGAEEALHEETEIQIQTEFSSEKVKRLMSFIFLEILISFVLTKMRTAFYHRLHWIYSAQYAYLYFPIDMRKHLCRFSLLTCNLVIITP